MELPLGDQVAAMVFIGCGLGIAYIFELQREGIQLVPGNPIAEIDKMFQ